ncbi:hypothetical protein LZG04_05895 [Saccharothrix sp. S26]|uniref:hypothetical protein n=1 Tax=Saccharothrix sp. S26 TaxID=2907215 RepID=UPI001F1B4750|nr:hypothetical protein [Saccharothrix sp. S26]MCE6994346.1 hypothetical protein [Saccharothrix sp. S26]
MRWVIGAVGVVMGLWGAVLVLPLVDVDLALWFVAGPVVHDVLLAPLFAGVGLLVARWVPPRWRAAVLVGGTFTGVLVLLAVPLLWRPFAGSRNPGLLDRDYPVGLLVAVGVVWAAVLVTTAVVRERPRADR